MKVAIAHLRSVSPYSQSRYHDTPKLDKERPDDYEMRTWAERLSVTDDGHVFIPPMAFKKSIETAARFLGMQIKGRGMNKPFDRAVLDAMIATARHLVGETHARIGYVQSDEISLCWLAETGNSDVFFSGKTQKMASVLASMAAAMFATVCPDGYQYRLPHFDCRVFNLPSKEECANTFLWRAMDAKKNAISLVAQSLFSPKQLHGKNQADMHQMVAGKGVHFDDYPEAFTRGTFLRRETAPRELTTDELARIPKDRRPCGPVLRSSVVAVPMPLFNTVANRVEVIFDGAKPTSTPEAQ